MAIAGNKRREEVEKVIRSCLVSRQGNVTIEMLDNDYYEFEGEHIPFREFNFSSLSVFLRHLTDTLRLENRFSQTFVIPLDSEKSRHVRALVEGQKPKKTNHRRTQRPYLGFAGGRSQCQLKEVPHEIRISGNRLYSANKIPSQHNSFHNPSRQHNSFPNQSFSTGINKRPINRPQAMPDTSNARSPLNSNDQKELPVRFTGEDDEMGDINQGSSFIPAGYNPSSCSQKNGFKDMRNSYKEESYNRCQDSYRSQESYPETQNNLRKSPGKEESPIHDTPSPRNMQGSPGDHQNPFGEQYDVKNTNEFESHKNSYGDGEDYHDYDYMDDDALNENLNEDRGRLVSPRTKFRLTKLIQKYPEGIWCADLPNKYLEEYNFTLNYSELGFDSVREFASQLPSIFHCVRPSDAGDFKLYNAEKPPPDLRKKDRIPTQTLAAQYYLEEPDQPEPLPDRLDPSTCKRLIPDGVMESNETIGQISVTELGRDNDFEEVIVSEVFTPSFFWIQLRKKLPKFKRFMDDLHTFYEANSSNYKIPLIVLEKGLNVACVYGGKWHRGIIKTVPPEGNPIVHFYDYGTVKSYDPNDLFFLHRQFSFLAAQAIPCSLFNVKPYQSLKWSRSVTWEFVRKTSCPLVATIGERDEEENSMRITLTDTRGDDDFHINDWMYHEKFAERGCMVRIRNRNFAFCHYVECMQKKGYDASAIHDIITRGSSQKSNAIEKNNKKSEIACRVLSSESPKINSESETKSRDADEDYVGRFFKHSIYRDHTSLKLDTVLEVKPSETEAVNFESIENQSVKMATNFDPPKLKRTQALLAQYAKNPEKMIIQSPSSPSRESSSSSECKITSKNPEVLPNLKRASLASSESKFNILKQFIKKKEKSNPTKHTEISPQRVVQVEQLNLDSKDLVQSSYSRLAPLEKSTLPSPIDNSSDSDLFHARSPLLLHSPTEKKELSFFGELKSECGGNGRMEPVDWSAVRKKLNESDDDYPPIQKKKLEIKVSSPKLSKSDDPFVKSTFLNVINNDWSTRYCQHNVLWEASGNISLSRSNVSPLLKLKQRLHANSYKRSSILVSPKLLSILRGEFENIGEEDEAEAEAECAIDNDKISTPSAELVPKEVEKIEKKEKHIPPMIRRLLEMQKLKCNLNSDSALSYSSTSENETNTDSKKDEVISLMHGFKEERKDSSELTGSEESMHTHSTEVESRIKNKPEGEKLESTSPTLANGFADKNNEQELKTLEQMKELNSQNEDEKHNLSKSEEITSTLINLNDGFVANKAEYNSTPKTVDCNLPLKTTSQILLEITKKISSASSTESLDSDDLSSFEDDDQENLIECKTTLLTTNGSIKSMKEDKILTEKVSSQLYKFQKETTESPQVTKSKIVEVNQNSMKYDVEEILLNPNSEEAKKISSLPSTSRETENDKIPVSSLKGSKVSSESSLVPSKKSNESSASNKNVNSSQSTVSKELLIYNSASIQVFNDLDVTSDDDDKWDVLSCMSNESYRADPISRLSKNYKKNCKKMIDDQKVQIEEISNEAHEDVLALKTNKQENTKESSKDIASGNGLVPEDLKYSEIEISKQCNELHSSETSAPINSPNSSSQNEFVNFKYVPEMKSGGRTKKSCADENYSSETNSRGHSPTGNSDDFALNLNENTSSTINWEPPGKCKSLKNLVLQMSQQH